MIPMSTFSVGGSDGGFAAGESSPFLAPGDMVGPEFREDLTTLTRVNQKLHLDINQELVAAVARLNIFERDALYHIIDTARECPLAPPRGELVSQLDQQRSNITITTGQVIKSMMLDVNTDQFVASYLIPGEKLVDIIPYESASLSSQLTLDGGRTNKDGSSSGTPEVHRSTGRGKLYLTSHRLLLLSNDSKIFGTYDQIPLHSKTGPVFTQDSPLVSNLRRKIKDLASKQFGSSNGGLPPVPGLAGVLKDVFSCEFGKLKDRVKNNLNALCCADPFASQKKALELEIQEVVELHPEGQRRPLLIELLKLLYDRPCCGKCDCSCNCNCCAIPREPYRISITRSEHFSLLPLSLDKFLHAELSSEAEVSRLGGLIRERACWGMPCCWICSTSKFSPPSDVDLEEHNLNEAYQQKPVKDMMLQFGLIYQWGVKANLRIRVDRNMTLQRLGGFLGTFHTMAPMYSIQSLHQFDGHEEGYTAGIKGGATGGVMNHPVYGNKLAAVVPIQPPQHTMG